MASTTEIADLIRGNIAQGLPPLKGTPIDDTPYAAVLFGVFRPDTLMLEAPSLACDAASATLTGRADLFGTASLAVAFTYKPTSPDRDDEQRLIVRALLSDIPQLGLLRGLTDGFELHWTLGPLGADHAARPLAAASSVFFSTRLRANGGASIPMVVIPGTSAEDTWRVHVEMADPQGLDLGSILGPLGVGDLLGRLPPGWADQRVFSRLSLELGLVPHGASWTEAHLALETADDWQFSILDGRLAVSDVVAGLRLDTRREDGADRREVSAALAGTLDLWGQTVDLQLAYDGSARIGISMLSGTGVTLPSLRSLADVIGRDAWLAEVPEAVQSFEDLRLSRFEIEIDTARHALTGLTVAFTLPRPIAFSDGIALRSGRLLLALDPADGRVSGYADTLLDFGAETLPATARLEAGRLGVTATADELSFAELAARLAPGLPASLVPAITLKEATLGGWSDGTFAFEAAVEADFHRLAEALKVPLPEGLAAVTLDRLALGVDKDGAWSLDIEAPGPFRFPDQGANHLDLRDVRARLSGGGGAGTAFELAFVLGGAADIAGDLRLESTGVRFSYRSDGGSWQAAGALQVRLFGGAPLAFGAEIVHEGGRTLLALSPEGTIDLVDAPNLRVVGETLRLVVSREGEDHRWAFSGNARFDVADRFLVADGRVAIEEGQLSVSAHLPSPPPPITLPLAVPNPPTVAFELGLLSLTRSAEEGVGVSAAGSLKLAHMPYPASLVFPDGEKVSAELRVGKEGIDFRLEPAKTTIKIAFGDDWVVFPEVALRELALQRRRAGAEGKPAWRLAADIDVHDFDRLNALFGGADLFRKMGQFTLRLGDQLGVVLRDSPLQEVELDEIDGHLWTRPLTIPDTGTFRFEVPEMALDFAKGRWKASGGVESLEDISIPLGAFKWLLAKADYPPLLAALPDKIPLVDLDIEDPSFTAQVRRMLQGLSPKIRDAIEDVITKFVELEKRLPDRLRDYFKVSIPDRLTFDVDVEGRGGFGFRLATKGDPVKLLTPGIVGSLPGLIGTTVHSASFGLTAGGSVARIGFDGHVDCFDVATIAYALLAGDGSAAGLSNRIVLEKLTALAPTAAPLPIPLFFDRLGWEYLDPLGTDLRFHASFPDPDPTVAEWFALIAGLVGFFTLPDHYLHKDGLPEHMPQVAFGLGRTGLTLPKLVGGADFAVRPEPLPELDVTKTLALALDSIKAGRPGWLIQSVPLKVPHAAPTRWIRIGRKDIGFGPLTLSVGWCVTTSDEFKDQIATSAEARALLDFKEGEGDRLLGALPDRYGGKPYPDGYVVLLKGGLKVGTPLFDIYRTEARFGVASMGPHDFQTGFSMTWAFGPDGMLELGMEGLLSVGRPDLNAPLVETTLAGAIWLTVATARLELGGSMTVSAERLSAAVTLALGDRAVVVTGTLLIERERVALAGTIAWQPAAGVKPITQGIGATFSSKGVRFDAFAADIGAFAVQATLRLPGSGREVFAIGAELDVKPDFTEKFRQSVKSTAKTAVRGDVSEALHEMHEALGKIDGFTADLATVQRFLPGLCASVIKQIENGRDKTLPKAVRAWVKKNVWGMLQNTAYGAIMNFAKPEAERNARPWIDKLNNVKKHAEKPIDDPRYRSDLQAALRDLITPNRIEIRVGRTSVVGVTFPGVLVYSKNPLLDATQRDQVTAGIDAIARLPEQEGVVVRTKGLLDRFPDDRLLAEIERGIDEGIAGSIPTLVSAGFETGTGLVDPARITLTATVLVPERGEKKLSMTVDLTDPAAVADAVGEALVKLVKPA